jgi:DNA (cytosine-5)-methyltransferase 1
VSAAKPPYRVPSMAEVRALPWNGLVAASTFSGCGGSSLGYRMAGFRMLWASEFVPAARDSYRANAADYTVLDGRDIREATAADVLAGTGLKIGQLDLLDGSPPCASFSTSGKREAGWGKVKKYSDTAQRTDDLFYEFARLVRELQPRVFVAENVSGLVKGTAKGYFIRILTALRDCGYRVEAKLLDAQWLGVPQARQRLIFVGVRRDLNLPPVFPAPLPYRYAVREVLPHILRQGDNGGFGAGAMRDATLPSGTIGATPNTGNGRFPPSAVTAAGPTIDLETGQDISIARFAIGREWARTSQGAKSDRYINLVRASVTDPTVARKFTLAELRRICGFPDDFILTGTYEQRWERLGRAVPPVMMAHIAAAIRDKILIPAAGATP